VRESFQPLAILASVILLSAESRAAIIHVSIPEAEQEFLALGEARSRDFDFNQDGRNDVRFTASAQGFIVQSLHFEAGITTGNLIGQNFLGQTAVPLLYGDKIERWTDASGWGITATNENVYLLSYGALEGSVGGVWYGKEAYMGFALLPGDDFNFGWLRIREFGGFGGYFLEYAYETELNVPIFAGKIPEPSVSLLTGSMGILILLSRWRREVNP